MATKRTTKNYALIYFKDKKPIKRAYDTASKAFDDFEEQGCILVELFNSRGILIASIEAVNRANIII